MKMSIGLILENKYKQEKKEVYLKPKQKIFTVGEHI